jgi:hypothetical protein
MTDETDYWRLVAKRLREAGWMWDMHTIHELREGVLRNIYIADAYRRGHPARFIVRSDQLLVAFLELERVLSDGATT